MKERPILFSGAMVRALLAGTKTQTRRIVKPQPYVDDSGNFCWNGSNFGQDFDGPRVQAIASPLPSSKTKRVHCPNGKPGDRLWVRETFFAYGRWETRFSHKKGRDEWHFIDMTAECDRAYQFPGGGPEFPIEKHRGALPGWWKRPAIHMPRAASRILLEIVSVGVERLTDISEADCIAEGIEQPKQGLWSTYGQSPLCDMTYSPKVSYQYLWESINGAGSWAANPWVWVIEFKRVASAAKEAA